MSSIQMANIPAEVFHTLEVGFQPDKYAKEVLFWVVILIAVCAILLIIERGLSNRNDGIAIGGNQKAKERS